MNRARKIAIGVSLALLILGVAGSFMTRGVMEHLPFLHGQKQAGTQRLVPQESWTSGPGRRRQTLATLAVSAEELEFAREAERLADHEVDQAFSQSLRQASAETRELKGEALALQQRVTELQQTVKEDQAQSSGADGKGQRGCCGWSHGRPATIWSVAKAQLGLDQTSCRIRWKIWRARAEISGERFSRSYRLARRR